MPDNQELHCYDCGAAAQVLTSVHRPGLNYGVALCDECLKKEEAGKKVQS